MNSVKEIETKIVHTTFFDDMINIKNLDSIKIIIDENSNKNVLIYYIR